MEKIIERIKNGDDIPKKDLQKIVAKIVRFFKRKGFLDVSQNTRKDKNSDFYFCLRIQGKVTKEIFSEASKICPATKTQVVPPDGYMRNNYYSYFCV